MREMRRSRQLLGEAETLEILDRGSHGVLALIGDGGYPYALPISYAREGDRLYMHCAKAGHKLDALRALLRRRARRGRARGVHDALSQRDCLRSHT